MTVFWEASGTRAELCALDPFFRLRPYGCQAVPLSGTLTIATALRDRYYARFSLRVYDDLAPEAFAPYAELAVPINCPDTWMAAGPPPDLGLWDCPAGPAHVTAGAAQRFERGGMYWLEEPDTILVYGDSGGKAYVADLPQNQPDTDPTLIPPPGLYQPVRGFGLVWRGLTALGDMRPALGWAVEPEYAYTFSFQCNAAPDLRNEACYVLGPHGLTVWRMLGWSETLWP